MVAQDYSIQHLVDEDYYSIGALWFNGSCAMIDIKGQAGVDMFMTWHIFGDGSLAYRTDTPSSLSVYHDPGISSGQTTFFVDAGMEGALVCLSCPGEIIASGYTNINGQVYLSLPPTISCPVIKLTVTAYNRITYQGEVLTDADGVWAGTYSTDWYNANNWMDGDVPDATTHVTIISGRPHYPVVTGTAECMSLTIESGANLDITGFMLTVNGDLDVAGELRMTGNTSQLIVTADVTWQTGSSSSITGTSSVLEVRGHWDCNDGSDVSIDYGFVKFTGAFSSTMKIYDADFHFRHLIIDKDPGKYVLYSNSSTQDLHVSGNMFIYTDASYRQYSIRNLIVDGQFDCDGIHLFYDGTFVYNGPGVNYTPLPDCYFNHLTLNSSGTFEVLADTDVRGDLVINSGAMDLNGNTLTLQGDWTNNAGTSGFVEGTSRVIFNGSANQTINNDETFHTLEMNNTAGDLVLGGHGIECSVYDWTSGGLDVSNGSFTASDLADSGIFGDFILTLGGTIDLTNSDGWIDLNASISMTGGNFYVRGGTGSSWWPFAANASLTMSGGTLDFTDQSIYLNNSTTYTLTENITGGTIRTVGHFTGPSTTFNPAGGQIELYGSYDADLAHGTGSSFYSIKINKSAKENGKGTSPLKMMPHSGETNRDGSLGPESTKSEKVTVTSALYIDDDLGVDDGSFDVNGYIVNVNDDLYISGNLIMDASADQINVADQVDWGSGATAACTAGKICFGGAWNFLAGSEAILSPGHKAIANGAGNQNLKNNDDNSCFGDLDINNPGGIAGISLYTNNPVLVSGNMALYENTSFQTGSHQLIVNGITMVNTNSTLEISNNGGLMTYGDFNCLGTIHVDGGNAFAMDDFLLMTGGTLIIDGGQFVLHKPYSGSYNSIGGNVELNGGILQVTYNGIQFGSASNFIYNGGDMKIGWSFRALYAGTFQPGAGTVEFIGTGSPTIDMESTNYFHDLKINKETTGTVNMAQPLSVNHDLTLSCGSFNTNGHDLTIMGNLAIEPAGVIDPDNGNIFVNGNWSNDHGDDGFMEGNSDVTFSGPSTSYINTGETFYNLMVNKSNPSYCLLYLEEGIAVNVSNNLVVTDGMLSLQDNAILNVTNDMDVSNSAEVRLYEGHTNCRINVNGVMEIAEGGAMTIHTGDTVVFNSDFIHLGTLDITNASVKVHGFFSSGQYSSLILHSGEFIYDEMSTGWGYLRGSFSMNGGLFEFTHRGMSASSMLTSSTITGGQVRVGGNFEAIDPGRWLQTGGTTEFFGNTTSTVACSAGNHFYDLIIDKGTGTLTLSNEITVKRHFTLLSGFLNTVNYDVYVGGSWTNNAGPNAFIENNNSVVFNSNLSTILYTDENFYRLEVNKPDAMKNLLHVNDGVSVNVFNNMEVLDGILRMKNNTSMHVAGGMTLFPGSIAEFPSAYTNANLMVDGTMYIHSGGLFSMDTGDTAVFNSGFTNVGDVDLTDASVTVHGLFSSASGSGFTLNSGEFVYDQTGTSWVYLRGDFAIYDGLFEFTHRGLSTSSLMTSSVISGGMIRAGGHFQATDAGTWMQTGGVIEFMGNDASNINCSSGNHFNNVRVNKGAGAATLLSDITLLNDITIMNGELNTGTFDMYIGGDWSNTAGPAAFIESTNKVVFNSNQSADIYNSETFYDLEVNKPDPSLNFVHLSNSTDVVVLHDLVVIDGRIRLKTDSDLTVDNNMTLYAATEMEMPSAYTNARLEVNGTMDVKTGSVMSMHTGDTAVFNGTFILAGSLNLTDASVQVHGFFSSATSSHVTMNTGEFIYDEPATTWVYLRGEFNMYGGLFACLARPLSLYSGLTSTLSGGTIRLGSSFSATTSGTFQQNGGTTELTGSGNATIQLATGNFIHDLDFNRSGGTAGLLGDMTISRDVHIISGYMETNGHDLYVGRNWTNDAGPGSVLMNSGKVEFFTDQPAAVRSDQMFFNMMVNKPLTGANYLEIYSNKTVEVAGNLEINDGTLKLNHFAALVVNGPVGIQPDAGLNANPAAAGVEIRLKSDLVDNNTTFNDLVGFNPGSSEVILEGSNDQALFQAGNLLTFYDLTVDKNGGSVEPDSRVQVNNDCRLVSGRWYYGTPGLHHYFYGDLLIGSGGLWSDNTCTLEILGAAVRSFGNQGSNNTDFGYFRVDMMGEKGKATAMLVLNSDMEVTDMAIYDGTVDVNNCTLTTIGALQVLQDGLLLARNSSVLEMGDGANLWVSGGQLTLTGTPSERARVTAVSGGYYMFAVDAGGKLAVRFADLEYMNADGIRITQNGSIINTNPFSDCSFAHGEPGGALLRIENDQNLYVASASFPDNTWGGLYNVSKTNNAGSVNLIDATGGFAGEAYEHDPYGRVHWSSSGYQVSLVAFLEGPYNGGAMNTYLTTFIPLSQPYNTAPWNYTGTESVASVDPGYVDWILVELRDATSAAQATPATVIARQAAFIRNDGRIVSYTTGGNLEFSAPVNDQLFVVLWHRNHIGIISGNPLALSGNTYTYDFSTSAGQVYGGINAHKELDPGLWGMAGGDGNADGQINNGDKLDVWSPQAGTGGYLAGDFNMDNQVNNGDKNDVWVPNTGMGGQVPGNTQLTPVKPFHTYKCCVPE
ncbi:MAG: hypothetical protein JW861_02865 [Bacteroidales bacterium]|nr:hypothetical protein [Bacteroidales bacterium]